MTLSRGTPVTRDCSSICFSTMSVWTYPGQIALQVIPSRAVSSAVTFVNPTNPCLAATYADLKGEATSPCAEAMLTIRPQPRPRIPPSAARVV